MENIFEKIIDTAMYGLITTDENQRIIVFNKSSEKTFGIKAEEAIGQTIDKFVPLCFHEKHKQSYDISGETNSETEYMGVRVFVTSVINSGQEVILEASISQFEFDGHRFYTVIYRNVTDRIEMEKARRQSGEKFSEIFRNSPIAMGVLDLETLRITDINKAFEKLYGYSSEEVVGKTSQELNLYDDPSKREEMVNLLKSDELIKDMEITIRSKDGNKHIILSTAEYLTINGKKILLSVSQDITERKLIEESLVISEERFATAFNSNPNALLINNILDGTILEANDSFIKLFGYAREEIIGKTTLELNIYSNPEDRKAFIRILNREGFLHDFEIRIKTKSGEERIALLSAEILKASMGLSILTIIQDITLRKLQEKELTDLNLELKRSNKELEQFAFTASHDLQEPIRMINSFSRLLEKKFKDNLDASAKTYFNFVFEGAERMQQLIDDLLKYSRITFSQSGNEEIDFNILLKEVLDNLKLKIMEEEASVQVGNLPIVKGTKTQLSQLFQNLIQNAIKFRSEKNPEIKISCERRKKLWLFSMSDNGIGIDKKYYERIFVIFQRLYSREKYPGTGIGLALCKKIVDHHGGQIWCESQLGKGTTFYFTLPV